MDFRLLGPIEVWVGERRVPLGGAKPQALLGLLMLERGRVVPTSRIIDVIWGEDPPETVRSMIHVYIASLRRALAEAGLPDVIVTRAAGYVLEISEDQLDRDRFLSLLTRARAATLGDRAELLAQALRLWRGPALGGPDQPRLAGEAARLEEHRLAAAEDWLDAEVELGRHDQVLAELTGLVARHPANERLRGRLMVALSRQGRQQEALEAFHACRDHLRDELGIDPGPALTALHERILRGQEEAQATTRPAGPVPRMLPRALDDFTGRAEAVAQLTSPDASPLRVISGPGGMGKSVVAAYVARQLAPSYPDGQLYAELRGMTDAPAEPGEVLARFLKALGVEARDIPEATADRAELFRVVSEGKRLLLLLDDAQGTTQITPLLPASAQAAVLITSRDRLLGLAGASLVELGALETEEAMAFFARVVGSSRAATDPDAALRIIGYCGGLPLAIRIAGARLTGRRMLPLAWLADRLADESRRLDELSLPDVGLRAGFELSHQALSPRAQRMLKLLGYFGVPDFAAWTPAWLSGTSLTSAEAAVEELVEAQLVECPRVDRLGQVRYSLHDLVRLWARERAEQELPEPELTDAVTRVLEGWLAHVRQAANETPPDNIRWRKTTSAAKPAGTPADMRAWFEAEQTSLVAGVERAAALGLHELAGEFAPDQYSTVLSGVTRFDTRARIIRAVLEAARRAGDRRVEATITADLGQLYYLQDQYSQARVTFNQALALFRELSDLRGQAATLTGLGAACREPGRLIEALHFLTAAVAILRETDDDLGIGYALRLKGSVHLELGDFAGARADLTEAMTVYRRAGSRLGEALSLRSLGLYHRGVGAHEEAARACEQARVMFRELGDVFLEAYAVRALWKARMRQGQLDPAGLAELGWALRVSREHHDQFGAAATLRVLGEWHLACADLVKAESALTESLHAWSALDTPLWTARTEYDLSLLRLAQGRPEEAEQLRQRALTTFLNLDAREYHEINRASIGA